MKLYFSPASPYVRKVMASAWQLGLQDEVEKLPSAASPVKRDMTIAPVNPLGKVPTAFLDDGTALIDSRTICEYLHSRAPEKGLFPDVGPDRWEALRLHAIADGVIDAALLARYELAMRPTGMRWDDWTRGLMSKIDAGVSALELSVANLETPHIGTITAGCALGYLDFRFPDLDWRKGNDRIADWWSKFATARCMTETLPTS